MASVEIPSDSCDSVCEGSRGQVNYKRPYDFHYSLLFIQALAGHEAIVVKANVRLQKLYILLSVA